MSRKSGEGEAPTPTPKAGWAAVDEDTARSSGEMFWMETFSMPQCPETVCGRVVRVGVGAWVVWGGTGSLWGGCWGGAQAQLGLTYSNITEVGDCLAFVGCHHDGRCHSWTPQLQVQRVVGTGGRQGVLVALCPCSLPAGPPAPAPGVPAPGPQIWVGGRIGTVTFRLTMSHPGQSTAPEAQGFCSLPVLDVTTGNDTGDHKLVKLPRERSGQGGLGNLVLVGTGMKPASALMPVPPHGPPAAWEPPHLHGLVHRSHLLPRARGQRGEGRQPGGPRWAQLWLPSHV